MSVPIPAREEEDDRPPTAQPPVVVTHGLTYRDLQRAIFLVFALMIVWHMAGPLTTLLLFFLLVFILAAVINPVAVRLQKWKVPRIVSAVVVALLLLGLLGLIGWLTLKPLGTELRELATNMPQKQAAFTRYYEDFKQQSPELASALPPPEQIFKTASSNVGRLAGQLGRYTLNVVVAALSMVLLLVLVIFTVANPGPLVTGLLGTVPDRTRPRLESALRRILEQLKNWAIGSLILGVIIGVISGITLRILGVKYALLFGIIAGIGEMIPNIGPIVSAIPPVMVALADDPKKAGLVLLAFIIIQQLENNLIVPMVMGRSLNLHPVSVTFTVLVMGALFGVLGAILAVPVCAIIKVCWEEFYLVPHHTDTVALAAVADDIVASDSPDPNDKTVVKRAVQHVAGDRESEMASGAQDHRATEDDTH